MREGIIVIGILLTPWILAAPSEFFWEDDSNEKDSDENDSDENSEEIKPKPFPTTTEKFFEIFNKPILKPKPDPPTTTTTTPKPVHSEHSQHPFQPFHHKPLPPPNPQFPQFFGNPFIFPHNPFPAFNPTPIGFLTQEIFSPVPGQTFPFRHKRASDEGVKRFGPQVTCPCVGGASDGTNPFQVNKRVKREGISKNNIKNLERRKKKKKKQKPTPRPTDVLLEESSNTGPGQTTIKEESIEGIQTGSSNTSETTQTHLVAYYMVYVVEVQQSKNNSAQTVVSEQTTSNVNQATASPEASFIAEAAGVIPTEETFSQFQGVATIATAKPGGINIDQTGSATNNGNGQQEGADSDEDEEGILLPLFDLTDDDKSGKT